MPINKFENREIDQALNILEPLMVKVNTVIETVNAGGGGGGGGDATSIQNSDGTYAVVSGTDTYTATLDPVPTEYVTGQTFTLNFTNANTGASTININSLGAKPLKKQGGLALESGDIVASTIYTAVYDGTNFQLDIGIIGKWYSYTPTFTGFSADPTAVDASYNVEGKRCTVRMHMTAGTSNATTLTITAPFNARSRQVYPIIVSNNNTVQAGRCDIAVVSNTNIITVYATPAAGAFTASGNKAAYLCITYEMF